MGKIRGRGKNTWHLYALTFLPVHFVNYFGFIVDHVLNMSSVEINLTTLISNSRCPTGDILP
jgi:hypothetical protein